MAVAGGAAAWSPAAGLHQAGQDMKGRDRIAASGQRSPEKNFGCSPYCLSALSRHKKRERPKTFSFFVRAGRDDGFP